MRRIFPPRGISVALLMLLVSVFARAAEVTTVPSLTLQELYDSNIYFARQDEKDDFITRAKPALDLGLRGEVSKLTSTLEGDFLYYAQETDLNDFRYNGNVEIDSKFSELWEFFGSAQYRKDTTLDSQLEETGRVVNLEDRHRYDYSAGLGFDMTELSQLRAWYQYRQVNYDSDTLVDYNVDTFNLLFNKNLKNEIDSFNVLTSYSLGENDINETDTYHVNLGWRRKLSETFNVHVMGGYRWSDTKTVRKDTRQTEGFVADVDISRKGEIYTINLGYRRNLSTGSEGQNLVVDRIYGTIDRVLSERSSLAIKGQLLFTKNDMETNPEESRYYRIGPSFNYHLTENHVLSLSYTFEQEYDKALEDNKDRDKHIAAISVRFAFPKEW
jgi:hypothetical protein